MKLRKLTEIEGGDSYEFAYSYNVDRFWSEDSVYLSDEDFARLSKFIDIIIENFAYYGPNKVSIKKWNMIKNEILKSDNICEDTDEILNIFLEIDKWIEKNPNNCNYFIIHGI